MQYTLTELIQKNDFIDWVLHPSAESNAYWQGYAAGSPEKKRVVASARGYVQLLAADTGRHKPTPEQSEQMWQVVQHNMTREDRPIPITSPGKESQSTQPFFIRKSWQLAASIVVLLAFSTAAYRYFYSQSDFTVSESATTPQPKMAARRNNTQKPMTVLLPDGSSVVLLPGGQLDYLSQNLPGNRAVMLSGKAFFEIVKDKNRPFYVFTDGLATKVLGTSFLLDAPANADEVKVEVRTGRVLVFKANRDQDFRSENVAEGQTTVLIPNQKSAFSRSNGQQIKSLVLNSHLKEVEPDALFDQSFAFDDTPVAEVFDALQRSYNIPIHYDRALLKDCTLNATLVGEPFAKKLSVICAALGTEYKISNDEVFVSGKACQ